MRTKISILTFFGRFSHALFFIQIFSFSLRLIRILNKWESEAEAFLLFSDCSTLHIFVFSAVNCPHVFLKSLHQGQPFGFSDWGYEEILYHLFWSLRIMASILHQSNDVIE